MAVELRVLIEDAIASDQFVPTGEALTKTLDDAVADLVLRSQGTDSLHYALLFYEAP